MTRMYCFKAKDDGESASMFDQVLQTNHKKEWPLAMEIKIKLLAQHKTRMLVNLPSDK